MRFYVSLARDYCFFFFHEDAKNTKTKFVCRKAQKGRRILRGQRLPLKFGETIFNILSKRERERERERERVREGERERMSSPEVFGMFMAQMSTLESQKNRGTMH